MAAAFACGRYHCVVAYGPWQPAILNGKASRMTESGEQDGTPSPGKSANCIADLRQPKVRACLNRYWRTNVVITLSLLAIWAIAGLGCGILFADRLNEINLPGTGFPLGFWFAQQGSIIVFVILILVYCLFMNRLDAKHHEELTKIMQEERGKE